MTALCLRLQQAGGGGAADKDGEPEDTAAYKVSDAKGREERTRRANAGARLDLEDGLLRKELRARASLGKDRGGAREEKERHRAAD